MTGTRVAVIVLILIGVIFFVGIGASLTREDDDPPPKDRDSAASAIDKAAYLRSLLRLPGATPKIRPADLLALTSATIITAPGSFFDSPVRASEEKYRTARFRLTESSAPNAALKIRYDNDCVPEGMNSDTDLGKQETEELIPTSIEESERCGSKDKACANLTIFKCGGNITFTCMGTGRCEVQLED